MIRADAAATRPLSASERIVIALDVETSDEARSIIRELDGRVGAFKIGLQLFTAAGPDFVNEVAAAGTRIFLDLKFHDIPNTVAKAAVEATKLGAWMFNVHAAGGSEMMKRTANEVSEYCNKTGVTRPFVIGVTVLTSSDADMLTETGVEDDVDKQVVRLAKLSHVSGLDGIVASPREVLAVREAIEDTNFVTVTPGIRPAAATLDDQKRVTTLRDALATGTDYVVIGRPITQAADRLGALEALIAEPEN